MRCHALPAVRRTHTIPSREQTKLGLERILRPMPQFVSENPAPLDVYYVVETTEGVVGERHHLVSSSLYATARQAETELERLATMNAATNYAVWKSSTYVEPARWAYDVVLADGTVLRPDASLLTGRS